MNNKTNTIRQRKQPVYVQVIKRLATNKIALLGISIFLVVTLIAIFAPLIAPYSPTEMDITSMNMEPSKEHIFGTDSLGRDILSRLIYGARYSLSLGLFAALLTLFAGIVLGTMAGYFGNFSDNLIMRIMDVWSSIPGLLLAIIISTTLGAGFVNTVIALSAGGIPGATYMMRAQILANRSHEYLEAAESINCSTFNIMFRQLLPNVISPLIVLTTMSVGTYITQAAGLSFIGLGIQPPSPEWGAMLSDARTYIRHYPYQLIFPGLCIAIIVLSVNLFGDGLRDAMDPKLKK